MGDMLQKLKKELFYVLANEGNGRNMRQEALLSAFDNMDEDLLELTEKYINILQNNGISISFMAKSYSFFLDETEKEEKFFYQEGHYRYSKLEDVINIVYNDEEYMQKYMTGLAVSQFIWPQHKKFFDFFRSFLAKSSGKKGAYLEVGAGHGMFTLEALKKGFYSHYDIVDISETSLALTKKMTAAFYDTNKIKFIHADFLDFDSTEQYDMIVVSEVLEHVEAPQAFLNKSKELLNDDGKMYLTTCINAPEIDHIYLFSTIKELEDLFLLADLKIEEKLYIPYKNKTIEKSERQKLPINVAYVLRRI